MMLHPAVTDDYKNSFLSFVVSNFEKMSLWHATALTTNDNMSKKFFFFFFFCNTKLNEKTAIVGNGGNYTQKN